MILKSIMANWMFVGLAVIYSYGNASDKIAVIYNRNTEVNSDAIEFMEDQFAKNKTNWQVVPLSLDNPIDENSYKAIVLLNTSINQGIDRSFAPVIQNISEKEKVVLLSLYTDRNSLKVETLKASEATLGVDGISGASQWKEKGLLALFGGQNTPEYEMHIKWVEQLMIKIKNMK